MSFRIPFALLVLLSLAAPATATQAAQDDVFPFKASDIRLDNGLRVVTIPYDSPGIVAYDLVVRTGSRDEVEPGHTGFAHFFEHMMFRGTEKYSADAYTALVKRMGANSNASTSDDWTIYRLVGPSRELETIMDLESDRFKNLKYDEESFRTEALAVLGEYNKNTSNPFRSMSQKLRDIAFQKHPYKHVTMGFLADIKAMPESYKYSLGFFDRFYRPENVTLLVVGDVTPEKVETLARKYFGDWKKGYQATAIPGEPPQPEQRTAHVDWPTPLHPLATLGWHTPAFSPGSVDSAALDVIAEELFGQTSPLFRELVVEKQWADDLEADSSPHRDPYLFEVTIQAKSDELMAKIQAAIDEKIERLKKEPVDPQRLERIKSRLRYDFALGLSSAPAIVRQAALTIAITGDVRSINQLFAEYRKVTPADVQRVAREVFRPQSESIVTLSHQEPHPETKNAATNVQPVDVVELHSDTSPLVSIRLRFNAGSIYDPPGKEGLASLTGLMIAQAGTRKHSYSALAEAFYPMAASIGLNVDREVATIDGLVHRDQLDAYTGLFEEALFEPAFADSDFVRSKALLLSTLTNTLRAGSDELLGLEALQDKIFAGHPYGHPAEGTVESLQRLTIDDVKAFYQAHFTRGGLLVGVAGGYPQGYVGRLTKDLSALPAGTKERRELPPMPPIPRASGRSITVIEKQTSAVGINLGFPLPVNRSDPDYFPLMVANSYLGEHRSFYGRLMYELRGARGLNYGDYSYIEYWNNPPGTEQPTPNVPRRQQYFSVWLRPVAPADAQFALRDALYEIRKLRDQGMTKQDFEATRDLLINYSKLWAGRLSDRLGILMDSKFYGTPYYIDEIEARLKTMTLEQVNAAARKYLDPTNFDAILVTGNAQQLKDVLQKDAPSPKKYTNPVAPAVLEADKTIEALKIQPAKIEVVPADQVFQK